ncbi:hypothetical protein EJ04DRAFT_574553 [Polyplosphaeria fusca]|uniref:Ubiquitin 3 binding protein But2 C-terminal domain-containing protein n=1 Tax=Polyplosphaeria fusca TaxID=682080 RepID=A0A9P4R1U5_9PLEO|nr:hypothetical protein EJ04DRAFT_574553 [Polyplosphaeria fusca]
MLTFLPQLLLLLSTPTTSTPLPAPNPATEKWSIPSLTLHFSTGQPWPTPWHPPVVFDTEFRFTLTLPEGPFACASTFHPGAFPNGTIACGRAGGGGEEEVVVVVGVGFTMRRVHPGSAGRPELDLLLGLGKSVDGGEGGRASWAAEQRVGQELLDCEWGHPLDGVRCGLKEGLVVEAKES